MKAKSGRPPHEPTEALRKTVALHATVGSRQETIAEVLGISVDTLQRYYRSELDTSREKANAQVGGALYNKAIGGDTTAMIFWLKTRARWRETVDVSNEDGSLKPEARQSVLLAILAKRHATE